MNQPDKTDKNYDRFWKIRSLFDMLSDIYGKFYNPSKHFVVGNVTVLLKGRVISDKAFLTNINVLKMTVFWDVAPCSLVEVYQNFKGACCLILLNMEAASTSEVLTNFNHTTQCNISEDSHLHTCHNENLTSHHKHFGIKIYKLCDMTGYTYNISIHLGKEWPHATQTMAPSN
jgi:hypothetical protein